MCCRRKQIHINVTSICSPKWLWISASSYHLRGMRNDDKHLSRWTKSGRDLYAILERKKEFCENIISKEKLQTPWPKSASELYRPSHRRLLAKLVPTFADRGCHMVSVTDPYGRILGFPDLSRYFFFQVAPQLYSRSWVDPVPDPLLLRKYGSAGNLTRTSGSVARNSDHLTPEAVSQERLRILIENFNPQEVVEDASASSIETLPWKEEKILHAMLSKEQY
jgi:hypothetical protein